MRPEPTLHRRLRMRRKRAQGGRVALVGALFVPLLAVAWIGSCAAALGLTFVDDVNSSYPPVEEALAARGGGAKIFDRNGTLLFQFLDEGYGNQERVGLGEISPWLIDATISAEDESFYSNPGISFRGTMRAISENVRPGSGFFEGSGGSSITQQLIKQLYFTQEERESRTIDRKLKEAVLAVKLTREHEKDQILEWYLNEIPYGNLAVGAQAASFAYFNVPAKDLTLGQAAFLAGLPQSPSRHDPFTNYDGAKARQAEVLDLMQRHGRIDAEQHRWALLEEIRLTPAPRPFLAPHFVLYVADYLKATIGEEALYRAGLSVLTTLDLPLQDAANAMLEENLQTYEASSQGHNGAVVVIQPTTGHILAMVGSRDYFREDVHGEVNNAVALNSPGSTLKPFTYATALMQGWSPDWPIIDSTIKYKQPDGKDFSPRNPDGRTRGTITLREALGNSFNIPAFKTILWAGVDNVRNTAKRMGITTLDRDLGPAMTLGGVDVKLVDLTYAYSVFANNGVMAGVPAPQGLGNGNRNLDPNPVLYVTNRNGDIILNNTEPHFEPAIDAEYAYLITEILSDDGARSITYGRGSTLNIPGRRIAVKTGTSEPYEDSRRLIGDTWTVGYSPDIAVGVWVGNSDNTPMVNISSTTIAGLTWRNVIMRAHEGLPARDWIEPPGIVKETVCVPSGIIAKGNNCNRKVTGRFVLKALSLQDDDRWWGGQLLSGQRKSLTTTPDEFDEWKKYLANEYFGRGGSRGGTGDEGGDRRPAQTPQAPPQVPEAPPPPAPGAQPTPQSGGAVPTAPADPEEEEPVPTPDNPWGIPNRDRDDNNGNGNGGDD